MHPEIQTVTKGRERYYYLMDLISYRKRMVRNMLTYILLVFLSVFILFVAVEYTFWAPYDFPRLWQLLVIFLFWPAGLAGLAYAFLGFWNTLQGKDLISGDTYEPIEAFVFVVDTEDSFAHFEVNHEGRRISMPVSFLLSVSEKDNYYFLKYDCMGLLPARLRKETKPHRVGNLLYKWFLYGTLGADADFFMIQKEEAEKNPAFLAFLQSYL